MQHTRADPHCVACGRHRPCRRAPAIRCGFHAVSRPHQGHKSNQSSSSAAPIFAFAGCAGLGLSCDCTGIAASSFTAGGAPNVSARGGDGDSGPAAAPRGAAVAVPRLSSASRLSSSSRCASRSLPPAAGAAATALRPPACAGTVLLLGTELPAAPEVAAMLLCTLARAGPNLLLLLLSACDCGARGAADTLTSGAVAASLPVGPLS